MLEILKKIFFALLPFLQKAAEDALNDATASKGGSESSQKSESRKDEFRQRESRQGKARTSGSSAPKPSASKSSSAKSSAPKPSAPASTVASDDSDYPGDYRDMINFEYSPSLDGDADPGEIVWTWVPFEEDHSQGKDRPVLLVGRDGEYLLH